MIKVKVCGMLDPVNIREIAGAGPDYLGFIFYPGSKRYVGGNPDGSLFRMVPPETAKVGVFVNETADRLLELAGRCDLQVIQLHGTEEPDYCAAIKSAGYQVIKAFGIGTGHDLDCLEQYVPVCDYFLFDSRSDVYGGSGIRFNWDFLRHYQERVPFFLSGGIRSTDTGTIREIKHPGFYAVDINSGFETGPGVKDIEMVRSFIKEIKDRKHEVLG